MERKTFEAFDTKVADADQGIVETIFAVAGNLDSVGDILHPGSFTKTFAERGHKVRVLDAHQTDSIMRVIGKPLELRELGEAELPMDLKSRYPEATGAAWARVQFLMGTPEGKGAFERIRQSAVDEWSFGYDALDKDYSKTVKDGKEVSVRNLRTVRLYELSPVLWGANPATATLSAKASEPSEGKPWRAVRGDDGKWRVYKLDADGQPTGNALGTHDSEDGAQAQVRALYANEPKGGSAPESADVPKALLPEDIDAIANKVVELLREQQPAPVEEQAAVTEDQSDGAGPPEAPTLMAQVEALERDLRLMEG